MKDYILEVCVDSVESAINATEGGANRLELCGNLIIGGTSPSPCLYKEVRKRVSNVINVLIRLIGVYPRRFSGQVLVFLDLTAIIASGILGKG